MWSLDAARLAGVLFFSTQVSSRLPAVRPRLTEDDRRDLSLAQPLSSPITTRFFPFAALTGAVCAWLPATLTRRHSGRAG